MGGLKWDYHQLMLTGFLILGFNGGLFLFSIFILSLTSRLLQ
jgi:hypothetical protein